MTAPEIRPSRLVTPDQHRLFDIGYQVGMHAALHDLGLIDYHQYRAEIEREYTIYRDDQPDSYDTYWLGRQVGYDIGHSPAIVACFTPDETCPWCKGEGWENTRYTGVRCCGSSFAAH